MSGIILIFLDGVGIGKKDPLSNPFFKYQFRTFTELFGAIPDLNNPEIKSLSSLRSDLSSLLPDLSSPRRRGSPELSPPLGFIFPSDAILGVEGLPQSGTGQASIFCGMNAPRFVGKHFGPYPYSTLIPVIKESNIFHEFINRGKKAFFMNAYPQVFFDYINSGKQRLSVTSLSSKLSGLEFNKIADVREGRALTAEITNERWNQKLGYDLPVIKPSEAASHLLDAASQNDLVVYEYYLTDHLGHGRYDGDLEKTLSTLDEFLFTVFSKADPGQYTILLCSDHGNFEDLSIKTHTRNPSLTISWGGHAEYLYEYIKDLTQIKQALLDLLSF